MKSVPLSECSTKTICPPNQSKTAIVTIPKNSLIGEAKLFLLAILVDNFNNLSKEALNF